jgi:hypothetical protein
MMIMLFAGSAYAGNFGFGIHGGYGITTYEENTDAFDRDVESDSTLDTFLFGGSVEYTLPKPAHFYVSAVGDWTIGLEDVEKWEEDDIKTQQNDISMWTQFYDARLGYRNALGNLYYGIYVSGGWDGIHFRRKNFVIAGVSTNSDAITEDFHLWRAGGGGSLGYTFGKWALDGRGAIGYYFDGEVRNSSNSGLVFDTNGTCMDFGGGAAYEIAENMKFYVGGSYTRVLLDESEVETEVSNGINVSKIESTVFPESKTQIIAGVVNLTFAF